MQVAGIIAEYNPFHNGHRYQLDSVRRETKADYIIIAMSGDFLQRGVPAILDKHTRTRMALENGADLVLELPTRWATASAEYFASAGVMLLGKTGVTNLICYGCEEVNPALMQTFVRTLGSDSDAFSLALNNFLKMGDSYPLARSKALCQLLPEQNHTAVKNFLASPNNILGLEYEKAMAQWNSLHSRKLKGHPIQRVGQGYHSTRLDTTCASATAIRKLLLESTPSDSPDRQAQSASSELPVRHSKLQKNVPENVFHALLQADQSHLLLDSDDFSQALYTRLWSLKECGYTQFADCSEELSNKIAHSLDRFLCVTQFADLLKSKNLTYTRICRALLHILLDIKREDYLYPGMPYLRVLGFRKASAPLLTAIKKEASVPLVTKVSDASRILDPAAQLLLAQDIRCADLYRGIAMMHSGLLLPNEYSQEIVIVP